MKACTPEQLLREHKLKVTKQRLLLLKEIVDSRDTFTVGDLEESLSGKMDTATIYRTISQFTDSGIVREVLTMGDTKIFEVSCFHNPVHPHFQCIKCKGLTCLDELGPSITDNLVKKYEEYNVKEISINLSGTCPKCK